MSFAFPPLPLFASLRLPKLTVPRHFFPVANHPSRSNDSANSSTPLPPSTPPQESTSEPSNEPSSSLPPGLLPSSSRTPTASSLDSQPTEMGTPLPRRRLRRMEELLATPTLPSSVPSLSSHETNRTRLARWEEQEERSRRRLSS